MSDVLDAIGGTSLVRLRALAPRNGAARIVTLMADSGMTYLSTDLYLRR